MLMPSVETGASERVVSRVTRVIDYDLDRFDFRPAARAILGCERLDELRDDTAAVVTRQTDQASPLHKLFYDGFGQLAVAYTEFVKHVAERLFTVPTVYYQKVPTFRVHLPGNMSVGEFHRDRDYNHQDGEINCWVPLTRAYGSNTVWIEADDTCYAPSELEVGQALIFDAVNLQHGNLINTTPHARVSFDFRLIDPAEYTDSGKKSVNAGRRLAVGDYFDVMRLR
jgi:hypothetical protein